MAADRDDQREMRVGDAERRAVDERLQRALSQGMVTSDEYVERSGRAWAARTRSDLEPLTRDLPPDPELTVAEEPASASSAPAERRGSRVYRAITGGLGTALLVVAGLFAGGAIVTSDDGAAVFGSRVVHVVQGQERVQVGVLFGSTEVVVPDDVRARTSGMMLLGSTECLQACAGGAQREVVVDARGAFGSVEVVTEQELAQGGLDEDDD
ncbi:DUF1707 domain-containing protein [Saccharopolyspora sp. HNM0983]|uniref:DUF1707 domain-containing protein n=1 Tax=Saccharopolyspora montiporae TaxID=2781240 RepID=A0A929G1X2_9PSEU|nr:DUF1707 domain-containing protein [Saccharopolyspora sp. HNM0983]MBE9375128.1 DUF1707 domain-containing protein [Saccharopolyspora sp. HNM0983]